MPNQLAQKPNIGLRIYFGSTALKQITRPLDQKLDDLDLTALKKNIELFTVCLLGQIWYCLDIH